MESVCQSLAVRRAIDLAKVRDIAQYESILQPYDPHDLKCIGMGLFTDGYYHGRFLALLTFLQLLIDRGFAANDARDYLMRKICQRFDTSTFPAYCERFRTA